MYLVFMDHKTGKTTIIKVGLSQALKRPFNFITWWYSDPFLVGHGYTYEGFWKGG